MRGAAALQIVEVGAQVFTPRVRLVDHGPKARRFVLERGDLAIHPVEQAAQDRLSILHVAGRAEALRIPDAGSFVLQEEADLREREPGVVAQLADEPQPLEVARVVEAVVALRARSWLEEAELLVVPDRARSQAGLGGDLLDAEEAWPRGIRSGIPRSRRGIPDHAPIMSQP